MKKIITYYFKKYQSIDIVIRLGIFLSFFIAFASAAVTFWIITTHTEDLTSELHENSNNIYETVLAGLATISSNGVSVERHRKVNSYLGYIQSSSRVKNIKIIPGKNIIEQFKIKQDKNTIISKDENKVLKTGISIYRTIKKKGEEYFRVILPITNKKTALSSSCVLCHNSPEDSILGSMTIEIPLDKVNKNLKIFKVKVIALNVVAVISIIVFIFFLLNFISKTLKDLLQRDFLKHKELSVASGIQKSMFPADYTGINCLNIASFYKFANPVGGDIYDYFSLEQGRTAIVLADVSGSGVPAAFISVMIKIAFKLACQLYSNPVQIMEYINKEAMKATVEGNYIRIVVLIIDASFRMTYSGAGNSKIIVCQKNTNSLEDLAILSNQPLPVGISKNYDFESGEFQLEFGDRLAIFSGGIAGSKDSSKAVLGEDFISQYLLDTKNLPLDTAMMSLENAWQRLDGETAKSDVSVLMLELDNEYKKRYDYRKRGISFYKKGNFSDAITELEKAISQENKGSTTAYILARAYYQEKKYTQTIIYLENYLQKNKSDSKALMLLSRCYYFIENYSKALSYSQKVCLVEENHLSGLLMKGLCLKILGNTKDAIGVFEKILILHPENKTALHELDNLKILSKI